MPSGLKRFLLWDYPRAGWQYDLIVALILAFIFLTPRHLFRDQPKASSIVLLPAVNGASIYWVEPALLDGVPEAQRSRVLERLIKARYGRTLTVVAVEPQLDAEKEVMGYMAHVKP